MKIDLSFRSKKIFFHILTALCIFAGTSLKAQTTDYYTGKTEIKGLNYEYKLSEEGSFVYLKNVNNTKTGIIQYWPTGEQVGQEIYNLVHFIDRSQGYTAFKEIFNAEEIALFKSVKGLYLGIEYTVDSGGNVIEVQFHFSNNPVLKTIDPYKFYLLEQKVKEKVKFRVEERCKVLEYTSLSAGTTIAFDRF